MREGDVEEVLGLRVVQEKKQWGQVLRTPVYEAEKSQDERNIYVAEERGLGCDEVQNV